MEGVGTSPFDCGNHFVRTSPPLSAIERFLCSPNDFTRKQIHTSVMNNEILVSSDTVCEFSSSRGAFGNYSSGFSSMNLQDNSFVDGESLKWKNTLGLRGEVKLREKNVLWMEKKTKGGSLMTLIKGQWTEEEDRLLVRLVKENGVKKWAQIAQKMVGRAGKQCRERWHNHLRPDIKKDSWSEGEEILLIEGHEKFGNRWAEIAKKIPGRSENAIKNHWNATKRRQNSRTKNKKGIYRGGKSQPSILQDYIRRRCNLNPSSTLHVPITTSSTITPTTSPNPSSQFSMTYSEPSDSSFTSDSTFVGHAYNDELLFMGGLLENIFDMPLESIAGESQDEEAYFREFIDPNTSEMANCNYMETTTIKEVEDNIIKEEDAKASHMYSDMYLSYLLEGVTPLPDPAQNYCVTTSHSDLPMAQPSYREMDLIEMISSSKFSRGITSPTYG